jgi:hypothetical protein
VRRGRSGAARPACGMRQLRLIKFVIFVVTSGGFFCV